jgi:hypothetical protein
MSTIQANPNQYIYPPRSQDCIPRNQTDIFKSLNWIAQYKYNDSHCLVKYCPNGNIELWNRHAERFRSYNLPDHLQTQLANIGERLGHQPGHLTILDGGLLDQKHRAIKDTIVIWDMLVINGQHLIGTTYQNRYDRLAQISSLETWDYKHASHAPVSFGQLLTTDVFMPNNIAAADWDTAWDLVYMVNQPFTTGKPNQPNYDCKPVLEGLVFKDPHGTLSMGFKEKNNDSWMIRSRVTTGRHQF